MVKPFYFWRKSFQRDITCQIWPIKSPNDNPALADAYECRWQQRDFIIENKQI
jgi:hypothetical protein